MDMIEDIFVLALGVAALFLGAAVATVLAERFVFHKRRSKKEPRYLDMNFDEVQKRRKRNLEQKKGEESE